MDDGPPHLFARPLERSVSLLDPPPRCKAVWKKGLLTLEGQSITKKVPLAEVTDVLHAALKLSVNLNECSVGQGRRAGQCDVNGGGVGNWRLTRPVGSSLKLSRLPLNLTILEDMRWCKLAGGNGGAWGLLVSKASKGERSGFSASNSTQEDTAAGAASCSGGLYSSSSESRALTLLLAISAEASISWCCFSLR